MREPGLAKALRYIIYTSAFVPLIIFSNFISPFHFGKVVVLRSMIEVMAGLYILLIWKDRSYLPKMTKVGWAFLCFAAAFSITTVTSVLPYPSFWGFLERMGGLFTFWHYFGFFVILTSVFKTETEWLNLFKLTIAIGVLSALYGFGQRTNIEFFVGSGGRSRIFGTIGNPALFAGYQILCSFLALTLFFHPRNSMSLKLFYGGSAVIIAIAALMTAVRGSILAIGVGLLVFALLYTAVYRSKKAKRVLLGLVGFLFLFVVMALLLRNTSLVKNSGYLSRVTDFSLTNYTVQTRFWAWQAGLKGWRETPKTILLGWGPENFNVPFAKHFNPKFFRGIGSETLFDRAHNMFVEILVTMGLIGFLTYLGIFAISLKVLWSNIENREKTIYAVGFIPLVIAYAIHNSFIFDTSANFLVFFTILGFISLLDLPKVPEQQKSGRPLKVNKALWNITAIALMIFISVIVYFINILPAKANYATTRAIVRGWNNDFPGAVVKYKEALDYDVPGKYEYRHRFAQYVLEKTNSAKITPELEQVVKLALEEVQKNINENPVDYLPYLYSSRLYVTLGKDNPQSEYNDKALGQALQALELSKTFVRTYYEIGQAYLNKKDYNKAAEYFKKAAELNPEVGLSYWYWGIVEVERGNVGFGMSIIEKVISDGKFGPTEGDFGKLVNLYLRGNDYRGLAWVYERLVALNPNKAQHHASLAVAYARIGKIDGAVTHAKEAARLDKAFEPEARSFIQSLGRQW